MTEPLPLDLLDLSHAARWALFLDFDGTLADIVDHPADVALPSGTRDALDAIAAGLDGAMAIVTGRAIADIDRFVAIDSLAVAGVHGLTRRDRRGRHHDAPVASEQLTTVEERLARIVQGHEGTFIERKPGSLAFHYRARPELEEAMRHAVSGALDGLADLHRVDGKMVVEIKGGRVSKGDAVAAFMDEAPFDGRVPVFAGDDVTDEDAFRTVRKLGGIAIKVGDGETAATHRAASPQAFRAWLAGLAVRMAKPGPDLDIGRNLP